METASGDGPVLIVEDDAGCADLIAELLGEDGLATMIALTGSAALEIAKDTPFCLMTLDLGLTDINGVCVLEKVRSLSSVPVIVVTGRREDEVRGQCWRLGANGYITKPFTNDGLRQAVNAMVPRSTHVIQDSLLEPEYHHGALQIAFVGGTVLVDGRMASLSLTEYRILSVLVHSRGTFVATDVLLKTIWPHESYHEDPGIVRVNVARLRHKLGDDREHSVFIKSEPGRGYCFVGR